MKYPTTYVDFYLKDRKLMACFIRPNRKGLLEEYKLCCEEYDSKEEARAKLEKVRNYRALASKDLRTLDFKRFYGCEYCADSRTKHFEHPTDDGEKIMKAYFCTHIECPYAEEIEKAGGYMQYQKDVELKAEFAWLRKLVDVVG